MSKVTIGGKGDVYLTPSVKSFASSRRDSERHLTRLVRFFGANSLACLIRRGINHRYEDLQWLLGDLGDMFDEVEVF